LTPLELTKIHSVAGLTGAPVTDRPFRSPHHTISDAGLIGGVRCPPGEVSLAHGVLFLMSCRNLIAGLEARRQPLEDQRENHQSRC
jgi:magnesium chelatase family protein